MCFDGRALFQTLSPWDGAAFIFTANPPGFAAAHTGRVATANWPGVGSCNWNAQTPHGLTESPEHEYGNTLSFFSRFQGQGKMYSVQGAQSLVQDPWFVCALGPPGVHLFIPITM